MLPTLIVALIIGAALTAITVNFIKAKKSGKHICSCGGNCSACPAACQSKENNK